MSLDPLCPLEDKLAKIKTPNAKMAAKDLVGKEETTEEKILAHMPNVLPGPKAKEYIAKNDEQGLFKQSKEAMNPFFKLF